MQKALADKLFAAAKWVMALVPAPVESDILLAPS
jgi:hypothetical protein